MKKVVLIEDSKVLATALTGALKVEGIECFWAADGVSGVSLAKREKPDLIFPKGCQFAFKIRKSFVSLGVAK